MDFEKNRANWGAEARTGVHIIYTKKLVFMQVGRVLQGGLSNLGFGPDGWRMGPS